MLSVFVIHDNEYLRIAIAEYLESQGYGVKIFDTVKKASFFIDTQVPDFIVLNADMTEGIGLLEQLTHNELIVPVYVLYKNFQILSILLSSNIILGKGPLDLKELAHIINQQLD